MKIARMAVLFVALAATEARTEPLTDTELRAAYCMTANKKMAEDFAGMANTQGMIGELARRYAREASDRFDRLRSYLRPRTDDLSAAAAFLAAVKRAETDGERLSQLNRDCSAQMGSACDGQQPPNLTQDCVQTMESYLACVAGELNDRWQSCKNLSWLPF